MFVVNQMALIEQLENDNWQELLRTFFAATLEVLKNDPYQSVGSAVDDLRAWIRQGGVARIKENLKRQMDLRQFPEDKKRRPSAFSKADCKKIGGSFWNS